MTRILITESRDWTDTSLLRHALTTAWTELGSKPDAIVVHGGHAAQTPSPEKALTA